MEPEPLVITKWDVVFFIALMAAVVAMAVLFFCLIFDIARGVLTDHAGHSAGTTTASCLLLYRHPITGEWPAP